MVEVLHLVHMSQKEVPQKPEVLVAVEVLKTKMVLSLSVNIIEQLGHLMVELQYQLDLYLQTLFQLDKVQLQEAWGESNGTLYAGGGGGGAAFAMNNNPSNGGWSDYYYKGASGGNGGGGYGGDYNNYAQIATAGTPNTGSGGGGGGARAYSQYGYAYDSGAGGSGLVIVKWAEQ